MLWVSTGASRRPAVSLSPRVAVRQRRSSPIHRHGLLLPATALAHSATRRRCVAGTALLLSIPGCCDTQLALERSPPHSCALVTWLCQLQAASWSWWLPLATWPCHSRAGAACHGAAAFRRLCNKESNELLFSWCLMVLRPCEHDEYSLEIQASLSLHLSISWAHCAFRV